MDDLPRIWDNRVRFEETDMQGIVFYGNYVTFQDETVTQFFREVRRDYSGGGERDWEIHVVNVDLDYVGQATLGDDLVHGARIERIGESSMTFEYAARRAADDDLLVEGTVTHVTVDPDTGETVRVPEEFREAVREFQETPPRES